MSLDAFRCILEVNEVPQSIAANQGFNIFEIWIETRISQALLSVKPADITVHYIRQLVLLLLLSLVILLH